MINRVPLKGAFSGVEAATDSLCQFFSAGSWSGSPELGCESHPDSSNEAIAVGTNLLHHSGGRSGFGIVLGRPNTDFQKSRQQVEGFEGGSVKELPAILLIDGFGNQTLGFQASEPFREDVRGDGLLGGEEFAKATFLLKKQVPDHKQAPFIAKDIEREGDRAMRALGSGHVRAA
jgi:hypothetical protein